MMMQRVSTPKARALGRIAHLSSLIQARGALVPCHSRMLVLGTTSISI